MGERGPETLNLVSLKRWRPLSEISSLQQSRQPTSGPLPHFGTRVEQTVGHMWAPPPLPAGTEALLKGAAISVAITAASVVFRGPQPCPLSVLPVALMIAKYALRSDLHPGPWDGARGLPAGLVARTLVCWDKEGGGWAMGMGLMEGGMGCFLSAAPGRGDSREILTAGRRGSRSDG